MSIKKCALFLLIAATSVGCNSNDKTSVAIVTPVSFSISGRILVADNTAKDSDVNDTNAPYISNDTPSTAQNIPNPVILGGYVNQPNSGPACDAEADIPCGSGRSQSKGDISDFYAADLRANQDITLAVANASEINDLDLYLYNIEEKVVDASILGGALENLRVMADGRYFVEVRVQKGASNYTLSISQDLSATAAGTRLSDDFVANEVIVKLNPETAPQAQSAMSALGLQTESKDTERRMLFSFPPRQYMLANTDTGFATLELAQKYETLSAVKALKERSDVTEASPNYRLHSFRTPNDSYYRYQWNYQLMNLPQAWDITTGSSNVIVAVVDTGVLLKHHDLQGKLVSGYDFIADRNIALDGDGLDPNPDDPGDQNRGGSSFHGTHVAGIIGALTNNSNGVAGIGWSTKIMPLRVLGKGGSGTDYDIEQAVRFAAGLTNDSKTVPPQRADIINLSLGGPVISRGFQNSIAEARKAGVIIVAAAGNDGSNTLMFPASLDGVISVSAVDINQGRASYSNYGDMIDIAAPGGDNTPDVNGDGIADGIISTVGSEIQRSGKITGIDFVFSSMVGTSMATPHVAGVISLMKAAYPKLTPQELDNLIVGVRITNDLGLRGRDDNFGYGLINAQKAVLAANELSSQPIVESPPQLVINPKSLNFGLTATKTLLSVNNGGSGTLQVVSIEDTSGLLTVKEEAIDGNRLGNYAIVVDRQKRSAGTYTATLTVTSTANTIKVPVIFQIGDPDTKGDAGHHYILLVNSVTLDTVAEVRASANGGSYDFRFDNIQSGIYKIYAGSDFNNDGYICDVGEACGAFLTLPQASSIQINNDSRTNVDFSTGLNVNFFNQAAVGLNADALPSRGIARLKQFRAVANY